MRDNAEGSSFVEISAGLGQVTGGAWTRPARGNPDVLKILDQTNDSIKDMVRNQSNASNQMLPMMMAMMMMKRQH